uniref:Uncharacterized protein n=1 Tax=Romanomermis culicivorax TaxID=13658 RepID=A0A915L1X8_ROMCU
MLRNCHTPPREFAQLILTIFDAKNPIMIMKDCESAYKSVELMLQQPRIPTTKQQSANMKQTDGG